MQKARSQPFPEGHRPPTACTYMVSGTFHSPKRGSFQFSLTVLVAIGRSVVLSLTGWSPRIHTGFHVSGATRDPYERSAVFDYGAVTRCGWPSHAIRLTDDFVTSRQIRNSAH